MMDPNTIQTYCLEIRWDFTGTAEQARHEAHRVAGLVDGARVTDIMDEDWVSVA